MPRKRPSMISSLSIECDMAWRKRRSRKSPRRFGSSTSCRKERNSCPKWGVSWISTRYPRPRASATMAATSPGRGPTASVLPERNLRSATSMDSTMCTSMYPRSRASATMAATSSGRGPTASVLPARNLRIATSMDSTMCTSSLSK